MGKNKCITSFFKRKNENEEQVEGNQGIVDGNNENKRQKASTSEPVSEVNNEANQNIPPVNEANQNIPPVNEANNEANQNIPQNPTIINEVDVSSLERDPPKRLPMWKYPVNIREQVRLAYISLGPYQIKLDEYKPRGPKNNLRRFKYAWFDMFPNWLEYSPTKHKAYCFLCYLCNDKQNESHGHSAFTSEGFDNWKKVNDRDKCPLLKHIQSSNHKKAFLLYTNLLNQEAHLDNFIETKNEGKIRKNRLRLKTTIDVVRWLTYQACALRGHDESSTSKNQGNFRELLKLLAHYNDDVAKVLFQNAPYNCKYTSSDIQQEIISIMANKVRKHIRSEVGDSWFCVMVDESRDESKKEQIAIVLRFVDAEGVIRERFLDLVHVTETLSATLKVNLWNTLLHYGFDVSKIRGQGYDGASNMRGEWNGLQALVREYSPYAFYVHCFAHRLQLALVCVSRDVTPVHQFFSYLVFIINVVCASSKRHDELQMAKADEIKKLLELGEIKSGKGQNQVGTLRRAGDTRWGSHFKSVCSLVNMFDVTRAVLKGITEDTTHATSSQRGDANIAYGYLQSFEFVLVLHLMKEVMAKTDTLC
ncbi:zinc finger MYM-type protein 1-like [Helianthus annuus]|uniref:zinc finger MYM-type protein 1-like n=1 Tax=Helianthus annuus TaxID=4232 RepID=UPI001652D375|nr:zinc finger MYM-type protein 1-like [Helianthus annuus]